MRKFLPAFSLAVAAVALLGGCQASTTSQHAPAMRAITVPLGTDALPIAFERMVVKLPRGQAIGRVEVGIVCLEQEKIRVKTGRYQVNDEMFTEIFRDEFISHNYKIVGDPDALFEDRSRSKAQYLVAGLITGIEANICYPMIGFGNVDKSSGSAYIRVEWQVYSTLDRRVVYKDYTAGSYETDGATTGGETVVIEMAFAAAVRNLMADTRFHSLVTRPKNERIEETLSTIPVTYSTTAGESDKKEMASVLDSVVTVRSTTGHGTGFFISEDGYLLTNEHVVKAGEVVRIILQNKLEIKGTVVRTDARRDVALIKIPISGVKALRIATSAPEVGQDAFAIGTPLDESLQGTVSKGIVSATRVIEGQSFLQSDANVLPGSSGGPLVNSDGAVIGITQSGRMFAGNLAGVNFFIPIAEAVTALKIKPDTLEPTG